MIPIFNQHPTPPPKTKKTNSLSTPSRPSVTDDGSATMSSQTPVVIHNHHNITGGVVTFSPVPTPPTVHKPQSTHDILSLHDSNAANPRALFLSEFPGFRMHVFPYFLTLPSLHCAGSVPLANGPKTPSFSSAGKSCC